MRGSAAATISVPVATATPAQRHRWVAAALLDIGPRLRKVNGYPFLPLLRRQLQTELKSNVVYQAA